MVSRRRYAHFGPNFRQIPSVSATPSTAPTSPTRARQATAPSWEAPPQAAANVLVFKVGPVSLFRPILSHHSMCFRPLLLGLALTTSLLAQHGDKLGETQAPPPEHIKVPPAPVLTAAEALRTFQLAPGFRLEIVAADPLVHDPVAM